MPKATPAVVGHLSPYAPAEAMEAPNALAALAAMGQPTRLAILRLLMRAEPDGMPAGSIAAEVGAPQNTLSSHLAIMARSGLVYGTREGRSIIYRARVERMRALIDFLIHDCCHGHPELCGLATTPDPQEAASNTDANENDCGCGSAASGE